MAEPPADLAGLVLAAGGARRFGSAKQLACLDGQTLVERSARLALGCCGAGVVVVSGAHAAGVEAAVAPLGVRAVRNDRWPEGLAGSLACGLRAMPPAAAACLVLLCDQPALTPADLDRLVAAWRAGPGRMAAAHYGGSPGVPAIFPRAAWPALLRLRGDQGARGLLAAADDLAAVDMPTAATDVDSPADLARLRGG